MTMKLSRSVFNMICLKNNRSFYSDVQKNNIPSISKEIEHKTITNIVLDTVSKDISSINPYYPRLYNLAAYVNSSDTLKSLFELNVDLSKFEKKPYIAEKLLKLDQSITKHIFFLKDFIEADEVGRFITKNPMILCEPLEDLEVRINYLQLKKFSMDQIKKILLKNPFWLMYSTKRIDNRLGFYQNKFTLSGEEIRSLTTKQPKIITYNLHHINTNTFVIKEEMGIEDNEVRQLILMKPKLWMIDQKTLLERFKYLHNVISHSMLLKFPEILLCRSFKVKQRHLFLKKLGRAQYDHTKENFISVKALVEHTDMEFCKKYAKCTVNEFNIFLKTL